MMEGKQRLIDANALMKELKPDPIFESHLVYKMAVKHAMSKVKDAPTIDAVPVVRCKDCRFRGDPMNCPMCHEEEYDDEDYGFDDIVRDKTTDEGYCQKGEREVAEWE